jgi:hypothetical protein
MSSTLIAHCGGTYRTREDLARIPTPAGTDTWKPIPHHEFVTSLIDDLGRRGIAVVREQYATVGRDGDRLFGVMDLRVDGLDTHDISTSLGRRGANDRSMAIQVIAAARILVCDNLAFSGSDGAVVLKKKHPSRLDLAQVVPPAIESYLEKAGASRLDIERMRDFALTDDRAKHIIHEAFTRHHAVLPVRLLPPVHRFDFDDEEQRAKFEDRSLWSLAYAFTEAVKALREIPQQRYGVAIGRDFGRVRHAGSGGSQVAIPADIEPAVAPVEPESLLDWPQQRTWAGARLPSRPARWVLVPHLASSGVRP